MEFNGLELSAMVNLATAMAKADGHIADTEKTAIANELINFGVGHDEIDPILKRAFVMSNRDAVTVVSLMNENQKKYVAAFLAVIIVADGEIEDSEIKMWTLISALCELPTMSIAEGLKFWRTN